jgi:hypothetical protein
MTVPIHAPEAMNQGRLVVHMNNYLVESELGYTNHVNGKYVTEDNATHIAVRRDDQWIVEVYEREELPL